MATFDPFTEQILGLREQQALAQKLRDQGLETPQGQTVSGWYVAPNKTQYLAQALKSYLGGQDVQAAQQGIKDLVAQRQKETQDYLAAAPKATTSLLEDRSQLPEKFQDQVGPSPFSKTVTTEPTTEDWIDYAMKAPGASPAEIAAYGFKGSEAKAARDEKIAAARIKAAADLERQRERAEDRLTQMKFAAAMRPVPPERIVNILGPSGESVATPISQVPQGASLWSPQAAKLAQENASKGTGRAALSDTLDVLAGQYNALNQGMGMPSTQNKWGSNLGAKLATTGPGQWLGQVAGTENQKARDIISQTRPLLLADIKKATGMTASEMNSNAELQMWLSVATDPQKGYEANMEALKNLENKFGLGRAKDGNPFTKFAPAANQNVEVNY